jgi:hypothetical protein
MASEHSHSKVVESFDHLDELGRKIELESERINWLRTTFISWYKSIFDSFGNPPTKDRVKASESNFDTAYIKSLACCFDFLLDSGFPFDDYVSDTGHGLWLSKELHEQGIFERPATPASIATTIDISSSPESERSRSPILKQSVSVMPKSTDCYYHTVIFFSNVGSNKLDTQIAELRELEKTLFKHCASVKPENRTGFILCTHYFDSDRGAVDFYVPCTRYSGPVRSVVRFEDATLESGHKPHIHVVYWCTTRDTNAGIGRIIKQWNAKRRHRDMEFRSKEAKVHCYFCLREYLSQGHGRILGTERIPRSTEDAGPCSHYKDRDASGQDDFSRYDPRNDGIGDLEGKTLFSISTSLKHL